MTISASASFNNRVNYTVIDSYANESRTDTDSQTITSTYSHGTGNLQINNAVTISGTLTASESRQLNLYNDGTGILKIDFGITGGIPLDTIKHLSVYNLATSSGADIEITTTGNLGVVDLLGVHSTYGGDGSGSYIIHPYSSFAFNSPYAGASITSTEPNIYINDIGGSGASFSVLILGVDNSQPTGTTPTSPY